MRFGAEMAVADGQGVADDDASPLFVSAIQR